MKKLLMIALSLVTMGATAQNVMKVEHKTGQVERFATSKVKKVSLTSTTPYALTIEQQAGANKQWALTDIQRMFVDPAERDDIYFDTADGTRQFLDNLYHMQHYGLPYVNSRAPYSHSPYVGHVDALTDCYQLAWNAPSVYTNYYQGAMSADKDALISYTKDWVWEAISFAWQLIENIDRASDLTQEERDRMVAEAKCLIAARYFDLLPYYGGLPVVKNSNSIDNTSVEKPRATFAETVEFLVGLLDEAIPALPWAKDPSRAIQYLDNDERIDGFNRYWTSAAAMALKAKILVLAASPLFNNEQAYYGGESEAEKQHLVWYGNYDVTRWQRALKACKDFFDKNQEMGDTYHLLQADITASDNARTKAQKYRLAYRRGYLTMDSPEVLHATRAYSIYNEPDAYYGNGGLELNYDTGRAGRWSWLSWTNAPIQRNSYCPTQEYVELFPYSNGQPFNWSTAYNNQYNTDGSMKLDTSGNPIANRNSLNGMFKTGDQSALQQLLRNVQLTRDPRLYENAIVNGQQLSLDWTTAVPSGDIAELWVNGTQAGNNLANNWGNYHTGYGVMKYYLVEDLLRMPMHWVSLSYSEMLLMYAECLAQTGDLTGALAQIDIVRKRVGLNNNIDNYDATLKTDKDKLVEEILSERVRELGFSGNRYFDLCRYKRTDWLTKKLHGLEIHRLKQNTSGEWADYDEPWTNVEKKEDQNSKEPKYFRFEKFELKTKRFLWDYESTSNEAKRMLLWPFPTSEIDKGYGLIQNPGW